ncbi:MAG: flagellar hook-basal body complex protein, partial [Phycisphaerales bacterium]|nr:flagellar hook-basal body complex protein [Phycisphaerales bacterium]
GVTIAGTQRNFNNGAITTTGIATDKAIEGDGFFMVNQGGTRAFTRTGAFQRNENNDLVSITGGRVLGYGTDAQFNIVQGNLVELNIPVGTLTLAEASRNVTFSGNLNASGQVASQGSSHSHRPFFTDTGLTTPPAGTFDLTTSGNNLYIDDGAGGTYTAFEGGDPGPIITITGVEKGGKDLGTHTFQFATSDPGDVDDYGQTIDDYVDFLNDVLGLDNTTVGGESLGGFAAYDATTGQIIITGNEGVAQDMTIETGDIVVTNNGTAGINQPFIMSKDAQANGESVRTSLVVFDSLGTPVTIDLTMVLQSVADGEGTTWEFLAESSDNAGLGRIVGLGTLRFDASGEFVSATNESFSLDRDNGAVSPLTVAMNFDSGTDAITALTDAQSSLAAIFQDGSPIGTLNSFSITEEGIISGSFTNGLTRTLGQVALAKFANPEGLVDLGNGNYRVGPNSGDAIVTSALNFGTGRLLGGALEGSNVDLSQEFINMILTSTGYSASSRVITTTDQLIDQLLVLGR